MLKAKVARCKSIISGIFQSQMVKCRTDSTFMLVIVIPVWEQMVLVLLMAVHTYFPLWILLGFINTVPRARWSNHQNNKEMTSNTLQEIQAILTFGTIAKNSDWSFNMAIYENICFTIFNC